jgi:hypothetical protein
MQATGKLPNSFAVYRCLGRVAVSSLSLNRDSVGIGRFADVLRGDHQLISTAYIQSSEKHYEKYKVCCESESWRHPQI